MLARVALAALIVLSSAAHVSAWTYTANFESGTVGQAASGTSGFSYAGSSTLYSTASANSGSKSAAMHYNLGDVGNLQQGIFDFSTPATEGQEVWARGYYYFAAPWSWTCSPVVKMLRLNVVTAGNVNVGYLSVFANSAGHILASNEVQAYQPDTGVSFDVGSWQCIEIYAKLSATAGIVRIWKNGVLVFEDTTRKTLNASTDKASRMLVMSYWNGTAPQDQTEYVDDFVATSETPSARDAAGNAMIGPLNSAPTTHSLGSFSICGSIQ